MLTTDIDIKPVEQSWLAWAHDPECPKAFAQRCCQITKRIKLAR